jgi:hypothetical protein
MRYAWRVPDERGGSPTHVKAFQAGHSPWFDVPSATDWVCKMLADWERFLGGVPTLGYKVAAISGSRAIFQAVKANEAAGAFDAKIEVVPAEVASASSKRTSVCMVGIHSPFLSAIQLFT